MISQFIEMFHQFVVSATYLPSNSRTYLPSRSYGDEGSSDSAIFVSIIILTGVAISLYRLSRNEIKPTKKKFRKDKDIKD